MKPKKSKTAVKAKPKKRQKHIDNPNKQPPADNGKHGGGRPVEWTPDVIEALADEMLDYFKNSKEFLLLAFTVHKDIPYEYLSRFAEENEKFNHAYKKCKGICELRLSQYGISADKPTFAIFCLKANYGWKETQAIEHTGNANITVDIEDDEAEE